MARHHPGIGEDHRPGQVGIGGLAPQFAVHEIGQAPEEQAERRAACDIVMNAEPTELVASREPENAERRADDPTVEGHAAFPQFEEAEGKQQAGKMGVVEYDIADSAAQDDSQSRVEHQILDMALGHRRTRRAEHAHQVHPADDDAGDIGDRIPFDVE
jgi:hypothetical protein